MKILSGGADHGRSADIDILNQVIEGDVGIGGGFFEGIQIHHDHVDGLNAVLGDGGGVSGIFAAMQNAAMHLGMQSFDAAIEHLGEAGELGNIFDRNPRIAQQLSRASGGNEFDAEAGELAGEVDQSGLIGDAENGALDAGSAAGHGRPLDMKIIAERLEILSANGR